MASWALVTGATAGIGESFTRLLADNNYNIVLVARDLPRLEERARALEAQYKISTHLIQADLATDAGCAVVEQYITSNQIDVLINNAGFGLNKAFTMSELVAEQQMMDVLVRTPMRLMHSALPGMKERNKGIVINVSSVAGYIAGGSYSAAKSYLTVISESLNTELAATNVKVSALCPGFLDTPLVSPLAREFASTFSLGVMPVEVAGDLAMRALTERINGSQWVVSAGFPIARYEHKDPFLG